MTYSAIVAFDYKNFCPSLSRTDTKTMTIQDIQKEVDEICVWFDQMWPFDKSMVAKKIPVSWMKGSSKTVGRASRRRVGGVYKYSIEFSKEFLNATTPVGFHSTILHECLHCIEYNGRDGWSHTGLWKSRAIDITNRTPFDINRTVQKSEITPEYQKIMMAKYKYKIVCDCGWECPRQRMSQSFRYIADGNKNGRYYCPNCGSKNLKAINLV